MANISAQVAETNAKARWYGNAKSDRRKMSTDAIDGSGVERRFSKEDRSECRRNVTRTREPVDCEPTEWKRP